MIAERFLVRFVGELLALESFDLTVQQSLLSLLNPEVILGAKVLLKPWNPEINWVLFPGPFMLPQALTPATVGLDELFDECFGETSAVCKLVGDLFIRPFTVLGDEVTKEDSDLSSTVCPKSF